MADAAKKPRTASNPGRYTLRDGPILPVSRRPDGERIVNEASISFFSPDESKLRGRQYDVKFPDGYDTWAVGWVRGGTTLWLQERGGTRSFDITDPAAVKQEPANPENVPKPILDALRAALDVPRPVPAAPAPAAPK